MRISVVESYAIKHACDILTYQTGEIPVVAGTKIRSLKVEGNCGWCEASKNPSWNGLCAYNCRRGTAVVRVWFRDGRMCDVSLSGGESDPRLGVSITERSCVTVYPRKEKGA